MSQTKLTHIRPALSILTLVTLGICLVHARPQAFKTQTHLGISIIDRELVNTSTTFDVGDGTIAAWTLATDASKPEKIVHQWYFNDRLISSIPLSVNSAWFRTFSRQSITDMAGSWTLKVTDPQGSVLETLPFIVKDRRIFPVIRPNIPNTFLTLSKPDLYRMYFSTQTSKSGAGSGDLHEIMMDGTTIYASVKCRVAGKNSHTVGLRIFDGLGRNLADWAYDMDLSENGIITLPYLTNPLADVPGLWRFLYIVDNEEIEDYLMVMPYGSAAVNSETDHVRITSLTPSDSHPLQAGTTVHFLIEADSTLDAEKGSLEVSLQQGDQLNQDDRRCLVRERKPITKGQRQATFEFDLVVSHANSIILIVSLIADNEERPRASDLRIFKIAKLNSGSTERDNEVEHLDGFDLKLKTHTRLGTSIRKGALAGEANAFDVGSQTVVGWTEAYGITGPTKISHRWYFSGRLINTLPVPVSPKKTTAYSRKTVANMVGPWTLMVIGPDNNVLETRDFVITDKRLLPPLAKEGPPTNHLMRIIFSTGINEQNGPVNDLYEVPIGTEKIFMFVKRIFLSEHQQFSTLILDGDGQIALRSTKEVCLFDKTKDPFIYMGYPIDHNLDAPGLWHFTMFLEDQQIDDFLWVSPEIQATSARKDSVKIRNTWPHQDTLLLAGTTIQFTASVDYTAQDKREMIIFDISTGDMTHPSDSYSLGCEVEPVTKGKGIVTFQKKFQIPNVDTVVVTVKLRPADSTLRFTTNMRVFKVKK